MKCLGTRLELLELSSTILDTVKNSKNFLYSVDRLLNLDTIWYLPVKYMYQKVSQKVVTIISGKNNCL